MRQAQSLCQFNRFNQNSSSINPCRQRANPQVRDASEEIGLSPASQGVPIIDPDDVFTSLQIPAHLEAMPAIGRETDIYGIIPLDSNADKKR
jgi:hypothetical protein